MPHVAGHKEFAPVDFLAEEEPRAFAPVDFDVGQGRTQQKFVPENNSLVTMPETSSASFNSRESKEFIEGQEGFFGNTPIFELLGAPGGLVDAEDIKKFPGGLIEAFGGVITGGLREEVILRGEKRLPTLANIEATASEIQPLIIDAATDLSRRDFRSGVSKLFEALGRARQILPVETLPDILTLPFDLVKNLAVQKNPEVAQRFNDKMLELQRANEDFLIRNGLMFGPDDEPTIVGNLLSQTGLTAAAIGGAILLKSPSVPAVVFGASQQVSGFQEAIEAGKDPFTASTIGDVQGIIEGGLTFGEIGQLTKIIDSKSVSIVKKIVAGMVAEGIEEGTTEALVASVQNITGVTDMTFDEALNTVFQAVFYGSIAGGGVTGSISTVQRMLGGDTINQEDIEKIARVMDDTASDTAVEVTEQAIDDANTELEIGRDVASGQPVTKAAKTTGEQQKRVIEIIQAFNEGEAVDTQALLDDINPEARIQRQKQLLEEGRRQRARTFTKRGVKEAVGQIQAEIQIAEQQGNEEEATRLSEELDRIHQLSFTDENVRAALDELQAEGVPILGSKVFEAAIEDIDNLLRDLRAGVRVGRALQTEESKVLQGSLNKTIDDLARKPKGAEAIIDPKTASRLKNKVKNATTVKNAESLRKDILSQARKAAFTKFKKERRASIDNIIIKNTRPKPKKGKLDPDFQNSLDSMNDMRKGRDKAGGDESAVDDFNIEQSRRIESDMERGIPTEATILQVRYLDILNEKSKVTPQVLAKFEDDLNAFIATGKGIATVAEARDQEILDATKEQAFSNEVKDARADIESSFILAWDQVFSWAAKTYETVVRALQLKGTVFDLFEAEISFRDELNQRGREINVLMNEVSGDNGKAYRAELKDRKTNVIDVPREDHTAELGGGQSKRLKMTRGELIYSWMLLQEESIKKQMTDPEGKMAWTDKLLEIIDDRMTDQDVAFARGLFEIYEQSYERFNAVYRRVYNRDLPRVEFYSHISREGKDGQDASAHNETMFINMIATEGKGGSEIFPSEPSEAKKRVKDASSEIKIGNVLDVFNKYNYDVEHFISHAEQLRLMDTLLRDTEFSNHLKEILTPGGFKNFIEHIKISARTNARARTADSLISAVFEKFRSNVFKATLGANIKIGVGQTATVMAWAPGMPKGDFASGVQDYSLRPGKANEVLNDHPTFRDRVLNFDPDIEQAGVVEGIFDYLLLPIRKGDGYAVRAGAWARYRWLTEKEGVSKEDALKDVAEFAERSQQSTLPSQRTLAQKSENPFVRTMIMFKSSPIAMFNVSMQSITEYRQADKSTKAKKDSARKKLIETLATQNVIIPAFYSLATGRPLTSTVLIGSAAGVPIISDMLEVIIGVVANLFREEDEQIFTAGPLAEIPISEAIEDINRAIASAVREGATMETFFDSSVSITESFTGLPVGNVLDMAEGAMDLFDTDDPIDAILRVGGYKEQARERTIERLELLTGGESARDSGRVLTQGAF